MDILIGRVGSCAMIRMARRSFVIGICRVGFERGEMAYRTKGWEFSLHKDGRWVSHMYGQFLFSSFFSPETPNRTKG